MKKKNAVLLLLFAGITVLLMMNGRAPGKCLPVYRRILPGLPGVCIRI